MIRYKSNNQQKIEIYSALLIASEQPPYVITSPSFPFCHSKLSTSQRHCEPVTPHRHCEPDNNQAKQSSQNT